jgi:hypothetical protein
MLIDMVSKGFKATQTHAESRDRHVSPCVVHKSTAPLLGRRENISFTEDALPDARDPGMRDRTP